MPHIWVFSFYLNDFLKKSFTIWILILSKYFCLIILIDWLSSKCCFSNNFILFSLFSCASQSPRILIPFFLFTKTLKAKIQMKTIARFSLFLLRLLLIIFQKYNSLIHEQYIDIIGKKKIT